METPFFRQVDNPPSVNLMKKNKRKTKNKILIFSELMSLSTTVAMSTNNKKENSHFAVVAIYLWDDNSHALRDITRKKRKNGENTGSFDYVHKKKRKKK